MDELASPLAAEIEALREAYAALNRGDVPAFVSLFDPEVERIEPADFPGGGIYHGLDEVTAHVSKGRGGWAEGGCEPRRFVVSGDRIVATIDVRVRLKHETEWREGRVGDVFTFRKGKAIQFRTFFSEREALDWAGIEALNTD
ncbi:nuclear transport factor 2 family protein [bacterium]|nr:MAG: nuclear transport factor 2 family protein [bacterium]